ncbi:MAG: caspase domain-containing protein [Muribaculaceae bacterium]
MKRLLTIVVMVMAMIITAEARTYVMSVGVSRYQDQQLNLEQTTKDAKQFKAVMENHTKNITILTSKYANRANVLEKLRAICNRAQKGDQIVLYFSCHGYAGGIYVYDGGISYETLDEELSKSGASVKVCIVDACHAGSVGSTATSGLPSSKKVIYMLGCRAEEMSAESPLVGHGFFTQALLKGIRGKADANGDKQITIMELFNYVYNDVQHTTAKMEKSQHPQLIGSKEIAKEVIVSWD